MHCIFEVEMEDVEEALMYCEAVAQLETISLSPEWAYKPRLLLSDDATFGHGTHLADGVVFGLNKGHLLTDDVVFSIDKRCLLSNDAVFGRATRLFGSPSTTVESNTSVQAKMFTGMRQSVFSFDPVAKPKHIADMQTYSRVPVSALQQLHVFDESNDTTAHEVEAVERIVHPNRRRFY